MVSEKPFHGEQKPEDGTIEIAEDMGADVIVGTWDDDMPMINCGLSTLKGYDWILFIAPDEYITKEDFKKIQDAVKTSNNGYLTTTMNTYFKEYNRRIEPREPFRPLIVIRGDAKLSGTRDVNAPYGMLPADVTLHHFSYFRTDEKVKEKMECFCHAPQIIGNWYEDVWLKWTPETRNFHPTHPSQYERTVIDEPPEEIRKYICNHPMFSSK